MPSIKNHFGLKNKFLLVFGGMFLVISSISIYLGISSLNQAKKASQDIGQTTLLKQIEQYYGDYTNAQKETLELLIKSIEDDVINLQNYTVSLYQKQALINTKEYWDSQQHLIHLENNQLTDINTDISTLWSPTWMDVNQKVIKKIEISAYLNEYFKPLLDRNENTIANYFLGTEGFLRYYPRVDMLSIFPPDFRTLDDIYFLPATPAKNPERKLVWTPLYKDPAGQGWMVSAIAPIYVDDKFIGVVGTDMTLNKLVQHYINESSDNDSYSILLDKKFKPIAIPKKAMRDIYQQELADNSETISYSLLEYQSDFKDFFNEISNSEKGFKRVKLSDRNVYISFVRLNKLDWLYAIIQSEEDMMSITKNLNSEIDAIISGLIINLSIPMLIVFTILMVIFSTFTNRFLRPIIQLSKVTRKISSGRLDQKFSIKAKDEIGQLVSDFSAMQQSIHAHQFSLKKQLKFQQLLMETVNTPIYIKDNKGIFIDCNSAFSTFIGKKKNDIIGHDMGRIVDHKFLTENYKSDSKLIKEGGSHSFIVQLPNASGELKDLAFLKNTYIEESDEVKWIVGTFFDITELNQAKKKTEDFNLKLRVKVEERTQELESINTQLESSLLALNKTQSKLIESEKMASLGGLVAGVAHEINTPVGIGLTGTSCLLDETKKINELYAKDNITQQDFERFLETTLDLAKLIFANMNRTADLVKSFKQVAVDQTSESKREFDIGLYIDEVLMSINNIIKKNQVSVQVNCPSELVILNYPGALSQVITNLVLNSIAHGFTQHSKGHITIDILHKSDKLVIIYKDDGKGISKENLPKIFDPFFTTSREFGGTGLGLNIIYNIISTKLSGTISCTSQEGKGAQFDITLDLNKTIQNH